MEWIYYILIGALCIGLAGLWVALRRALRGVREAEEGLEEERLAKMALGTELQQVRLVAQQHEERARQSEEQLRGEIAERAALKARLEASELQLQQEQKRHEKSEAEQQKAEETMRAQFKALAADILSEQSRRFGESSKESMDALLKPFKQNIADFRERVEKIYATEAEQHGALKNELQHLMELNRRITTETTNLTRALKGDSKVQGDFGEMILDTILSSSHLVKGVHYQVQDTLKNEAGELVRPDVILNLPDRKQIVIDSKTSLTAYVNHLAAETPVDASAQLRAHVDSVRKHVLELASKSYQNLMNCSPDFVIMFIPNESAFLAAMQADPDIWSDAYKRKVIISSPTNLFALLKLVDNLWQRSDLERNTRDIADCGSRMYDQLVAFADNLAGVEKGIKQAQSAYDEAYKRFTTGNNNLVRLGERMVGLHVKIKKRLPDKVLEGAELDGPVESETKSGEE